MAKLSLLTVVANYFENTMSQYWSEIVAQLDPYVPGEQPQDQQYIKLNTNENPYAPSPKVLEAIQNTQSDQLKKYPDPDASKVTVALAQYHQLEFENVFLGNGSDEVLAHAFQAFFQKRKCAYPDICYSFYPVYSELYQCDVNTIDLNSNFEIEPNDYTHLNQGIIFPNPNAPTSRYLDLAAIEKILKSSQHVVIIDEAYIDFGGESAVKLIAQYDNLLVIQTFSKSRSLAGLRLGYALGHKDLIEGLNRVKNSFNSYPIDCIAQAAAVASIKDDEYFKSTTQKIIDTRQTYSLELESIGFKVLPSYANFLMVEHKSLSAENLYLKLKEKGVLVRYFNKARISNYLRISIGTEEEMEELLTQLKAWC